MNQIEDLLRTSLRDRARFAEPVRRAPESDVRRRARRYRRRHRLVPAIGATAALAAGVAVVAVRQSDDERTSTAANAPEAHSPAAPVPFDTAGDELPLLALAEWTTRHYQEIDYEQQASPAKVLIEGGESKILVMVLEPPMGYSLGPGATTLDVNGNDAGVVERDDGIWISWKVGETTVVLNGNGVTADELAAVARGLTFDGPDLDITAVGHAPEGTTITMIGRPGGPQRDVEYRFVRDGASIQLHLYGGGRATYELRISGDRRSSVEVLGRPASLLDYGNGRYRVDVLVGDYTWEFDGEPFANVDEFLATVGSIRQVDQRTWEQSIADADVAASTEGVATETATTAPAAR